MKLTKILLIIVPSAILIVFGALHFLSRGAAGIFNKVMEDQKMLSGTVTVQKLKATPFGEVSFENFLWKDDRGGTILEIPEGRFKVSIFDALTRDFDADSIEELYLKGANVSLNFDENMTLDFIRPSSEFKSVAQEMKTDSNDWEDKISRVNQTEDELKELGEKRRALQRSKIEDGWKNFNLGGRQINVNLKLENCQFEIFYRERHYLLRNVRIETKINTADEMTLSARSGTFGGTMIGEGVAIRGKIDFKPEIPQCDLNISLKDVEPSSLGFGLNIDDEMTLSAHFTGAISQPVGNGTVKLKELHIPGVYFTNVEGGIHYEDATLEFTNVTADVYKGKLQAHGDYNFDTRYYNIYGYGDKWHVSSALPNSHVHCSIDVELEINSKGNAKSMFTRGSFSSGRGRYSLIFFDSLSGKFQTEYRDLHFYDVEIKMGGYTIATAELSVVDKNLNLAPIQVINAAGEVRSVHTKVAK